MRARGLVARMNCVVKRGDDESEDRSVEIRGEREDKVV